MSDLNETGVRLGLALYRKTILEGPDLYRIYDLVFDEEASENKPKSLFFRAFSAESDFWGLQEEAARLLDGAGLANTHRRKIPSSGITEYSLKLTPLGKAVYSLGHLQSDPSSELIEGMSVADVAVVLADENSAHHLATDLRNIDEKLSKLSLSNFQRASVNSYVTMLAVICEMPERDTKLFWTIVERLSQFAGVASLIVALIAMRLAR